MDSPSSFSINPRILPNDTGAEDSVLSSMLYDNEAIAVTYEILRSDDFYRPDNKIIYEMMIELYTNREPVDVITLNAKLVEKGLLEAAGGRGRIADIASLYFSSANIKQHSKIISEKAYLRRLISAANEIAGICYDSKDEVSNILEQAEKKIFDIAQNRNTNDFSHIRDIIFESIKQIEAITRSHGKITGISTGFTEFDNKTAGLQPSDLIVLGARPSVGKSAFLLNIAQHVSIKSKIPVAYFSLEMSKEQCINRILCAEANIDAHKLRTGDMEDDDWALVASVIGTISQGSFYIDDTPGISATEMRAKCRRLKLEKGLGLIMVDYLQLMSTGSRRSENRQQEISEISRALKGLAKELDCPVFTAAQLSRSVEGRADHRPMLSDLRESGAIEQDADVVAFLYRDEIYHSEAENKNRAELIIAKQRNGPTGTVDLTWIGKYTKFKGKEYYPINKE